MLLLLSVPLGFLSALVGLHISGLDAEVPPFIFTVLDPIGHLIAPLFGRFDPRIFALEGTNMTKGTTGCYGDNRMNACEDAEIHYPSSTVFLACSSVPARVSWFPPLVRRGPPAEESDPIFAYNLKSWTRAGALTRLNLKYPDDGHKRELRTHGLGIWYPSKYSKSPNLADDVVRLFLVNHNTTGSCISVFDHVLGSGKATWVRDVCHSMIYTPNGGPRQLFW